MTWNRLGFGGVCGAAVELSPTGKVSLSTTFDGFPVRYAAFSRTAARSLSKVKGFP